MRAAIYARYSSENQRPESIEDQISSCKKLAQGRGYTLASEQIYIDKATSGARKDRPGLNQLMDGAENGIFDVILVDDLSRLARDNYLMLSLLAELRFRGVRVISVADGLDTEDEEATMAIQVRGVFNELQLRDLKKKTLRGQIGQKERGFTVGERTFGYKSAPVGNMRMDKKGQLRPDGYKMRINPQEAAIVVRIFQEFAAGNAVTRIVRGLNQDGVPGRLRLSKGWSPSTVTRILNNEKYMGKWVWNKTETRRDPRTGRKRKFPKSVEHWIVNEDESLRVVSPHLWEQVQKRFLEIQSSWPKGRPGFAGQRGSRIRHYPDHLLSGSMVCGLCGATMTQVSGKSGGYYVCLRSSKGACDNRLLVRRTLVERIIVASVREILASSENILYLLKGVEREVARACKGIPEIIMNKESECHIEESRVANFLEFIGEGRGSQALAKALMDSEKRVDELRRELALLKEHREVSFTIPPKAWIEERVALIQEVLERRTQRSALLLRQLLGKILLQPTRGEIGRPYLVAKSNLSVLPLLEETLENSDHGSNTLRWRRGWDSNPRWLAPRRFSRPKRSNKRG